MWPAPLLAGKNYADCLGGALFFGGDLTDDIDSYIPIHPMWGGGGPYLTASYPIRPSTCKPTDIAPVLLAFSLVQRVLSGWWPGGRFSKCVSST